MFQMRCLFECAERWEVSFWTFLPCSDNMQRFVWWNFSFGELLGSQRDSQGLCARHFGDGWEKICHNACIWSDTFLSDYFPWGFYAEGGSIEQLFLVLYLCDTSPGKIEKRHEFLLQKNQFFAYSTYVFWHALILPRWLCQWVEWGLSWCAGISLQRSNLVGQFIWA